VSQRKKNRQRSFDSSRFAQDESGGIDGLID
jgi:hypothetical protein